MKKTRNVGTKGRKNVKHKTKTQTQGEFEEMKGDIFADGWKMVEPSNVHDLSMSSWALTSFLNDYDV